MQEKAWDIDNIKELMRMVMDENYRWQEGKYKGTPNWELIAKDLNITKKQATSQYSYTYGHIQNGNTLDELIAYSKEIGLYTPKDYIDWSTIIPHAKQLMETYPEKYVWQKGGNKDKPRWKEIVSALKEEGIITSEVDMQAISNAYQRDRKANNPTGV